MDRLTTIRLLVIAFAIVVWGYGIKMDNADIRIAGIALLAAALALRFLRRFRRKDPPASN
ncbi:MAG: hypothetical protein AABZ80_02785 [Gemmatimonadota bacterium]